MTTTFTPHGLVHQHSKDCSHWLDQPWDTDAPKLDDTWCLCGWDAHAGFRVRYDVVCPKHDGPIT